MVASSPGKTFGYSGTRSASVLEGFHVNTHLHACACLYRSDVCLPMQSHNANCFAWCLSSVSCLVREFLGGRVGSYILVHCSRLSSNDCPSPAVENAKIKEPLSNDR